MGRTDGTSRPERPTRRSRAEAPAVRQVSYAAVDRLPAPIQAVFAVLTNPDRIPEWLPGCQAAHTDDPVAPGVRIKARFSSRIAEFEVVDYAPPPSFG